MPWAARRGNGCGGDKPWAVVNTDTGATVGCHPSEESANRQVRALYANVLEAAKGAVVVLPDGELLVATPRRPGLLERMVASLQPAAKAHPQSGNTTAAMVAFYPDLAAARALVLEGGEALQDLHLTLAYLGPDAAVLDRERVEAALAAFTSGIAPLEGEVSGLGRFHSEDPEGWPLYASVDSPALPVFRQRLVAALQAGGVTPVLNHGFSPHITLAYVGPEDEAVAGRILGSGINPVPLRFDRVTLAWGADRRDFPLTGAVKVTQAVKAQAGPVVKADTVFRYTFGPWYPAIPAERAGRPTLADLDAHGEYATAEDLQKAVWSYVDHGDRSLRLQHSPDTEIGRWVELVSWPQESVFTLTLPTGETTTKAFAPGTVFMGAIWNEVGWPLVTSGRIRGYSLGGAAKRVNVEVAA